MHHESRRAVEANHMHVGHWKNDKAMPFSAYEDRQCSLSRCPLLILNIYTHRLIKDSSVSSDSHLSLTNAHFHSLSHSYDLLQNSSHSYAYTFIFLWVSFTPHTSLWMSIIRGRNVGSKETQLSEYTISHISSMHKIVIYFHWWPC